MDPLVRHEGPEEIIDVWRAMFESLPGSRAILSPDGTVLLEHQLFPHRTEGQFVGSKIWEHVPAEHRETVQASVAEAATGSVAEDEAEIPTPDGETRWFDFTIRPIWWDGVVRALLVMGRDITEQTQVRTAHRESEEKYRTLFQTMAQGVVYQDAQGRIVSANPAAEEILGISAGEMMNRNSEDPRWAAIHEDGSEYPGEEHPAMVALATGREVRDVIMAVFNPQRGEHRWINISAVPQFRPGEDGPHRVYASFTDITDRKRTEDALRESQARLEATIENLPFDFFALDVDGRYILQNSICRAHWGDLIGLRPEDVAPTDEVRELWLGNNRRAFSGETIKEEVEYSIGGEAGAYQNIITPIREQGRVSGILGVNVDVTSRHRAEESLRTAEREKGTILDSLVEHVIHHDRDMRIIWANRAACESVGLSREEVKGRFCYELWAKRTGLCPDCPVVKSMETGTEHRIEKVTPDGRAWLISGNAVRDEAGNVTGGVEVTLEITERKQVEEALRKSEAKHRGLFDTMAQGVVYLNTDGEITSANAAAERILGLSLDEMTRRESLEPRWRVIHEDGSEFAPEAHPSMVALRTGEPVRNVVMGVVNPHEVRHRWILVDAVPEFRTGEERPYRVYATFADITERRETEIALRKSRQMLQLVLDSIPARVFWKDRDSVYLGCNRNLAGDAGLESPDEIIGKTDFDLNWRELADLYRSDDAEVMKSGVPKLNYEEPQTAPDGTELWLQTSKIPLRDLEGNIVGVLGCYEDITQRRNAEEALRDREARLRLMLAQMPAVVWVVDKDLRFTSSQGFSLKGLELEPHQVTGRTLFEYFRTEDEDFPAIAAHRRALEGESVEYETMWNGQVFASHVEPLRDGGGDIIGCVGVALDVTERKRAEEELRASAESERLLLGELDHRVRNNLAALDSLINLGADSTTDVRQFAQSIGARVKAMATMHSLLSTSRWQPVRLQSLIEAMLIPGCHGRIELAGPAVEVPASQAQALGMVINELMTNSLKHGAFLSDNGTVRINWKEVREGGDQTRIALRWTESGGPPIETQPASGVGSALIIGLVKSELQGRAHLQYERRGANHRFEFTLADAMPWRSSISPADPIPPESG